MHLRRSAAAIALVGLVGLPSACGGGRSEARPKALLASSPESAAAFEGIRDAWSDLDHATADGRAAAAATEAMRAKIEAFIARYPKDGLLSLARIALAFTSLREGDLQGADMALALTADVPNGTTRELWTVARARRLRLGGDAEAAMVLLRPLVGKSVDPIARSLFQAELTLTAIATKRDYEAISYMDTWLRGSSPDEKPTTLAHVGAIVAELPRDVLVGALQAMSTQRASLGYGADIERVLTQRLVQIATRSGDAELARQLIAADPLAFAVAGDAGAALGELVNSTRGLNVVRGRTIGLLLPTDSPGLRDESADVLRGVMWALGLPRGARGPVGDAGAPAQGNGAGVTCAPLEPAPETPEPKPDDDVHLVTRDDAGTEDRTEVSLDELAGEGAAVIVAGLDPETSARALRWGEAHKVAVMVLVPPADGIVPSFGYVLGEGRTAVVAALVQAAPTLSAEVTVPVSDTSELASYPPQGGRLGGLALGPPVSCDATAIQAGEARFPLSAWRDARTQSWLTSGSADCSRDLVEELSEARTHGLVALTLEGAALLHGGPGLRVLSARAGIVPELDPRDPRQSEVQRFTSSLGRFGWWTALGRDAATLARVALLDLPVGTVTESLAVSERRAVAHNAVTAAHARLWTSESSGWDQDRTLHRTLCTTDSH